MSDVDLNIGDWDVENLRVTLFPTSGPRSTDQQTGLWQEVTGQPPDSIDSRPRQRLTRVFGRIRDNQLLLGIQDERVDWHVQPFVPANEQPDGVPTVATANEMLTIMHDAVQKTLSTVRIVQRLAFAMSLVREVPDVPTGMYQLSGYLPNVTLDPAGSSDFIYQINRRRRSASVSHAEINRLGRWSVDQIGSIGFRVVAGQPRVHQDESPYYVRKLVTDINTTPTTSAMANDRIHDLFHEMVVISNELATEGDVS